MSLFPNPANGNYGEDTKPSAEERMEGQQKGKRKIEDDGGSNEDDEAQSRPEASGVSRQPGDEGVGDTAEADDGKNWKRVMANRESARKSRIRRIRYMESLEKSVDRLTKENAAMLRENRTLLVENRALRQRFGSLAAEAAPRPAVEPTVPSFHAVSAAVAAARTDAAAHHLRLGSTHQTLRATVLGAPMPSLSDGQYRRLPPSGFDSHRLPAALPADDQARRLQRLTHAQIIEEEGLLQELMMRMNPLSPDEEVLLQRLLQRRRSQRPPGL